LLLLWCPGIVPSSLYALLVFLLVSFPLAVAQIPFDLLPSAHLPSEVVPVDETREVRIDFSAVGQLAELDLVAVEQLKLEMTVSVEHFALDEAVVVEHLVLGVLLADWQLAGQDLAPVGELAPPGLTWLALVE
jgi:hypothetical protein